MFCFCTIRRYNRYYNPRRLKLESHAVGTAVVNLLDSWATPTQNLNVGPDGTIEFAGFYGNYELTIGSQKFNLSFAKGTPAYSLVVAAGDYNGDGSVDAADYVVWRSTLGSASDLRADGNGNLVIDNGDHDIWRSAFGHTYAFATHANTLPNFTVPEPTSTCLLLPVAVLLAGQTSSGTGLRTAGTLARIRRAPK